MVCSYAHYASLLSEPSREALEIVEADRESHGSPNDWLVVAMNALLQTEGVPHEVNVVEVAHHRSGDCSCQA